MKKAVIGILAHVDAGKTTLSEALLYTSGSIRTLGRVDKRDAFLDTYALERERGITIFSKQALMRWNDLELTLLDTPGHVDFSAEMERVLPVLDYAVLVVSASDGIQGHTKTLWRLLERYRIPVFLFINKMDQPGADRSTVLAACQNGLHEECVDYESDFYETAAMCEEAALEQFLETGKLDDACIQRLAAKRKLFFCFFGSALKLDGIAEFLSGMERCMQEKTYQAAFGARVFKITRDAQSVRLTHMKITGGSLRVKEALFEDKREKADQIRLYSGEKYETVPEVAAGSICAVTGLERTYPGQGIGVETHLGAPVLAPAFSYRLMLPPGLDAAAFLPKLRQLEEEEPELHIVWEESKQEIQVQMMGEVQLETIRRLIAERFQADVSFGEGSIVYKETIADTAEGVGHYEPLRHYAEVHLLLEPGERGSGLEFCTDCPVEELDANWQKQILAYLSQKDHRGVLTGSVITDMRVTLIAGRAHQKHTEGGDFRQAAYRALRQGLMQAQSILLEPVCAFTLEVPEYALGRAMSDLEKRRAEFALSQKDAGAGSAMLSGTAPAATMRGFAKEAASYMRGQGRFASQAAGYAPCRNAQEVVESIGYDAKADAQNPAGSIFCAHGAGYAVSWDKVKEHMHVPSPLSAPPEGDAAKDVPPETSGRIAAYISIEEIDAILAKTAYANAKEKAPSRKKPVSYGQTYQAAGAKKPQGVPQTEYLLVDGYNILYAWKELQELAQADIAAARGRLLDMLCNYQAVRGCELIAVFDAYRVKGRDTSIEKYHNIYVVYTKEAETADQYIEKFAHENSRKYKVSVATSDGLEQIIIRGQGAALLSAKELYEDMLRTLRQHYEEYKAAQPSGRNFALETKLAKLDEGQQ